MTSHNAISERSQSTADVMWRRLSTAVHKLSGGQFTM